VECQGKSECEEKTDISLKDVSLKERQREARKPLFLTRYE